MQGTVSVLTDQTTGWMSKQSKFHFWHTQQIYFFYNHPYPLKGLFNIYNGIFRRE